MQDNTRYTVPEDVLTAHLHGEAVLLHVGTKNYYQLNPTAAAVWKGLERGMDRAGLLEMLCNQFEVDPDTAAAELERLLAELAARDLVTPVGTANGETGE